MTPLLFSLSKLLSFSIVNFRVASSRLNVFLGNVQLTFMFRRVMYHGSTRAMCLRQFLIARGSLGILRSSVSRSSLDMMLRRSSQE